MMTPRATRTDRVTAAALDPQNPPDLEALTAEEVIAWAHEHFGDQVALACSFQQEESVLVDMLVRDRPDARAFALDTGLLFAETYATWKTFEERFGIAVETAVGPTLEEQAAAHGDELWKRDPGACCGLRKVEPLQRTLSGLDAWITGVRRDQAPTRAGARKFEWDERNGLWKFNPLADWSEQAVWARINERDLPYHPLHDQGYSSIGCIPCTQPGAGREGRWQGNDKTECGLHG
jgi:phosphoadenosine phosphosulfate reductase